MKILSIGFIIAFAFTAPSCQSVARKMGYEKASVLEKKIEEKKKEIEEKKDKIIEGKDEQIKKANNGLYAVDKIYQTIKNPSRTDILFHNYGLESWAALGNQLPDYKTLMEINDTLNRQLDESLTSLDDLKKSHQKTIEENTKLADNTKTLEKDLDKIKGEKSALELDLVEVKTKLAELEKKRADDAEALRALKMKASFIIGALALVCIAGAVWSPVFKEKFGIMAGVLAIISYLIWYIQPWMIMLAFGIILALLVIWAVLKHNKESKAALATYQALQDIKNTSKDVWDDKVGPKLKEWQTKYVVKHGQVTEIPDPSIELHIDKKLAEVGDK